MLINKTHLSQVLSQSPLGHLVTYSDTYYPWFEAEGPMEWTAYTLSSIQVLLNLPIIIILIMYLRKKNIDKNSFFFIINLAMTDVVSFLILLIAIQIRASYWSNQVDPDIFSSKMRDGCRINMGLLSFSYLNTIFATLTLTVDRFLFISKPLTYGIFVTKRKIKIVILLTWIVPFLLSLSNFFTTNLDTVKICIVTHTSSKWANFTTVFLIFTTLVVIYVLYGIIVLKYWRLKMKMSAMRKKTQKNDYQKKASFIAKKVEKIAGFLTNIRYVIFVISVFTICWMPWILLVFYDIIFHQVGRFQEAKEEHCGHLNRTEHHNLTMKDQFQSQSCIYRLLGGESANCDVSGDEKIVCEVIHDQIHDFLIVCLSCLCACFSMIGSLINPFIHGFGYPGFRNALGYVRTRYQSQSTLRHT